MRCVDCLTKKEAAKEEAWRNFQLKSTRHRRRWHIGNNKMKMQKRWKLGSARIIFVLLFYYRIRVATTTRSISPCCERKSYENIFLSFFVNGLFQSSLINQREKFNWGPPREYANRAIN
jgi:hypothetical protein